MSYDVREAESLLRNWKEKASPTGVRETAAKDLVVAFEGLWKKADLEAIRTQPDAFLLLLEKTKAGLKKPAALIGYNAEGEIWVQKVRSNPTHLTPPHCEDPVAVHLDFDPVRSVLISREIDEEITPKPGEPKPRRSALTVLAETAINALNDRSVPRAVESPP